MSVCLSVCHVYIGPKSRTEMPRKTKIGTEVAHVIRDSDTTFRVKKSKVKVTRPLYSLPCWRVRQLQRWAWERVGSEKLLLRCHLLGRVRRSRGEERGGAYRGGCLPTACLITGHRTRVGMALNETFGVGPVDRILNTFTCGKG